MKLSYSITHFENKRLAKIKVGDYENYPMYFRFIFDRKVVSVKSRIFDAFMGSKFPNYLDLIPVLSLREEIIIKNIVNKIIEDKQSLSTDYFKEYYNKYSKNILFEISNELKREICVSLAEDYQEFTSLLKKSNDFDSIVRIMKLLDELNLVTKIDSSIAIKADFIIKYIEYYYVLELENWRDDNVEKDMLDSVMPDHIEPEIEFIERQYFDNYVPLIDLLNSQLANQLIHLVALEWSVEIQNGFGKTNEVEYDKMVKELENYYHSLKNKFS